MQITPEQLVRAAKVAAQIAALERARSEAVDLITSLDLGAPSAQDPLGKDWRVEVKLPIHATSIRIALVEQLTPLYTELRGMGIELKL